MSEEPVVTEEEPTISKAPADDKTLDELLLLPYDPNDYKDTDTGQWIDFDPDKEGMVILSGLENGRVLSVALFRMLTYIKDNMGGGGKTYTFAKPLVDDGSGNVSLTIDGQTIVTTSDKLAVGTNAVATAIAGTQLAVNGGKLGVDDMALCTAIAGTGLAADNGKLKTSS